MKENVGGSVRNSDCEVGRGRTATTSLSKVGKLKIYLKHRHKTSYTYFELISFGQNYGHVSFSYHRKAKNCINIS